MAEERKMMDTKAIKRSVELKRKMDTETIENEKNILIRKQKSKKVFFEQKGEESRLDCIYDIQPLGFEKPISLKLKKMESQDPLEEINLRTKEI